MLTETESELREGPLQADRRRVAEILDDLGDDYSALEREFMALDGPGLDRARLAMSRDLRRLRRVLQGG